jgi:hypothetical protein
MVIHGYSLQCSGKMLIITNFSGIKALESISKLSKNILKANLSKMKITIVAIVLCATIGKHILTEKL